VFPYSVLIEIVGDESLAGLELEGEAVKVTLVTTTRALLVDVIIAELVIVGGCEVIGWGAGIDVVHVLEGFNSWYAVLCVCDRAAAKGVHPESTPSMYQPK
jgi:hypothetical protein